MESSPGGFKCKWCSSVAASLAECAHHQKLHQHEHNFNYYCPWPTCHLVFQTFDSLNVHISLLHKSVRHTVGAKQCIACSKCLKYVGSVSELCHHLIDHLQKMEEIGLCPFENCSSKSIFSSVNSFRAHLSRYHKGWNKTGSNITVKAAAYQASNVDKEQFSDAFVGDDDVPTTPTSPAQHSSSSDRCDETTFESDEITKYIAKFYLRLEGESLLATSTVQMISETIAFLTEMNHNKMKNTLCSILTAMNIDETVQERVVSSVLAEDELYNAHHKDAPGPSLTSAHLRLEYFRKHFQYSEPIQVALSVDSTDSKAVQYIPVKQTLSVLLRNKSIMEQVTDSFRTQTNMDSNNEILRNYTCGSVFQKRMQQVNEQKHISLLIFQDAFGVTNPIGASKKKHKMLGMYMTLGNLKPHHRAKLSAMRLVLMCEERSIGEFSQVNCFDRVVQDLKQLETEGIEFCGEVLRVCVQFILGDNLGSHFIGGYLESFNVEYFCRFCEVTKTDFENSCHALKPVRTPESYEECIRQVEMKIFENENPDVTRVFSEKGIKAASVFNSLNFFHVADPGLPPCLGHDLFEGGVVDCDLALIIHYFVYKKKWFKYLLLNRRIAHFKCQGSDIPNKPAFVLAQMKKIKSPRLGGSAVQNWALLRLLPLIIGDKIEDPTDDIWQLYLSLKEICTILCAPNVNVDQLADCKLLIANYLTSRKTLFPDHKLKPKHHYFCHYPDLTMYFGPLIHLWTLRFESFHSFFKRVIRRSANFINVSRTLALRHQLMSAYLTSGENFSDEKQVGKNSRLLILDLHPVNVAAAIRDKNFSPQAIETNEVSVNGLKFKNKDCLLLGPPASEEEDHLLIIGMIETIIYDCGKVYFVVTKHQAYPVHTLGLFKCDSSVKGICVIEFSSLQNPTPHPLYELWDQDQDTYCFSLKNTLLPFSN